MVSFNGLALIKVDKDPIGSMGNDAALACLSEQPRMLSDYLHQLFAQVRKAGIDSIREEIIMSLECYIGPEGNLLDTIAEQAHRLREAQGHVTQSPTSFKTAPSTAFNW